jgi:signal transduction histidine kinase
MRRKMTRFSRRYQAALRKHLKQARSAPDLRPASGLGRQAMSAGLKTLDLARIHQQALIALVLPSYSPDTRDVMVRRAGAFFAETITPIEKTHRIAHEANAELDRAIRALNQRAIELATSNRELRLEITRRKAAEKSLRESELHYSQLLEQSGHMQKQLRLLSRQLLLAQEEERKKISRELHDVIAQTLTSINVQLATLKKEAALDARGLERNIARTQKLVEQSVDVVHRFARELRPTVLDDLGLIPALHTFMKNFREETGMRVSLSAFAAVEKMNGDKRTVLYRVAQEALTNVGRHAQASRVEVKIEKVDGCICMKIKDDGKGFEMERVLSARRGQRLGLLGMRERLDMVGGKFTVTSKPGKGTTVLAQVPLIHSLLGGGEKDPLIALPKNRL